MKEIKLDLFKLHDENDGGEHIKVILNNQLKQLLKEMVNEIRISSNLRIIDIIKHLGITQDIYYFDLRKNRFPLFAVKRLIGLWGNATNKTQNQTKERRIDIQDSIENLRCGGGRNLSISKCPKFLTENLCKITGAMIADGNLYTSENEGWKIAITDLYKDNLDLFSKWIESEFGLKFIPKPHKKERSWRIVFSNKIVFYYLNRILEIPEGKKSYVVKMPEIIKNSPLKYQQAFAIGISMFECGIGNYRTYIGLGTKSKLLFQDMKNILKKFGIEPDVESEKPLFQFFIWNKDKIKRFSDLFFEINSTKWKKIKLHLNEFGLEWKDLKELKYKLNELYPKRRNVMHFNDVINMLEEKTLSGREIQQNVRRDRRNVSEILNKLNKWDIINFRKRKDNQKIWSINPLSKNERR